MIENYKEKVIDGLAIMEIAKGEGLQAFMIITKIINDFYDLPLRCALYENQFKNLNYNKTPSLKDLEIGSVSLFLMFYKRQLQTKIISMLGLTEDMRDDDRLNKSVSKTNDALAHKELVKELKQHHQPHELGTVAEIAQKYGISKSEVRRRKADGTLEEFIKTKGIESSE